MKTLLLLALAAGHVAASQTKYEETLTKLLDKCNPDGDDTLDLSEFQSGPHTVHSHAVHLPLGALLSPCTMCATGSSA